jgi:multicomponent Na+:H+ antiporter subunit E
MSDTLRDSISTRMSLRRGVPRVALFALLWWALTGGEPGSWWFGVPAVFVATLTSLALLPAGGWRWTPAGIARFLPFFLWQSLVGGVDVASRALRPGLTLERNVLHYPLRLPESPARVFMADAVSLVPGTLSIELGGGRLRVHTISDASQTLETLRELESKTADLFGLELTREETADEPEEDRG